jgi:hypothetical protein
MSDWRHAAGILPPVRGYSLKGLRIVTVSAIAKEAGMFMFGRHAARRAVSGYRDRPQLRPAHRS